MDMLFIPGWLIFAIVAAIVLIILLAKGYVNAKPNEVVVITGLRKQRHLRGKAGFMIPFVEQRSYLVLSSFLPTSVLLSLYQHLILSTFVPMRLLS